MICQCCKTEEVSSKKRPLCKLCYTSVHKEGLLHLYPLLNSNPKENLSVKYGQSIIDDFNSLKNNKNTLQEIGRKYGFSRERARQIYKEIFGFSFTVLVKQRRDQRIYEMKNASINKKNPDIKIVNYTEGTLQYKGALSEKKVLDRCRLLGYDVRPYTIDNSIDMVINGYLVDVKSSYTGVFKSKSQKIPIHQFEVSDSQSKADFIICHIVEQDKFFVIPYGEVKPRTIYISKSKPSKHWGKYLEAWSLLQPKVEEATFNIPASLTSFRAMTSGA